MGFCITTSFGIDEGVPIVVITTPLVDTGICWPIILALALERLLMTQHPMPMITPVALAGGGDVGAQRT